MAKIVEIDEELLDLISGGAILYNYNKDGSVTCGINDPTQFKVFDYPAFKRIVKANYGVLSENAIFEILKSEHVIGK